MIVCADAQGTHRVSYDDGDVQDEDLLHGDYRILDGQDSHVRPWPYLSLTLAPATTSLHTRPQIVQQGCSASTSVCAMLRQMA